MGTYYSNKLNHLLSSWTDNTVKTAKSLVSRGYSHRLLSKYVTSGWIKAVGVGAYAKNNSKIPPAGAVYPLQNELNLPVHIGGVSALSEYGLSQYIYFGEYTSLYNTSANKKKLPGWLAEVVPGYKYYQYHLFDKNTLGIKKKEINSIEISISIPERALLESLALVPHELSFQHGREVVENAVFVSPGKMQELLEDCRSIKVKRLFLYLADDANLPCFSKLDLSKIGIGSGKRKIGEGGAYISKYKISVPPTEDEQEAEY